jgi:hypothetical protein
MYTPLPLPPHVTDAELIRVVRNGLDPRLHDVHTMLRLPLNKEGLDAGCNFTIADALFGVIEGVSAVLWPRHGKSHAAFEKCVTSHYHSADEPGPHQFTDVQIARTLYGRFRSPMQHALGLALKPPDRQGIREPDSTADPMVVFRDKESLDERQIEQMEQGSWPGFLHRRTLERCNGVLHLTVESFYVGTRRLIASVLAEKGQMEYAARHLSPPVDQTMSSAHGEIVQTRLVTLVNSDATAPSMPAVDTTWMRPKDP